MKLISIGDSTKPDKKMMAVFLNEETKRRKTVHFGQAGADDFTITKSLEAQKRYLDRHANNENWNDPTTAGALSRWVLWNKTSKSASIADYKRRFGF